MAEAREQSGHHPGWPAQWHALEQLCGALQLLESGSQTADPDQYQLIVQRISRIITGSALDNAAMSILGHYPAAAELYENLTYGHGELALHEPRRARQALRAARQAINAVRGAVR